MAASKCTNCMEDVDEKFRRCPNCGALNSGFKKENPDELKQRITVLETEIAELKKNGKKADGTSTI